MYHSHNTLTQVNVEMVIKTMEESGKNASHLIQAAVTLMAQEDWKDTVHQAKVYIGALLLHCD